MESCFLHDEDISVVVQGPITIWTKECLSSVRLFLPKSKIILSTWENSDIAGLDFDEVIFNKDPYIFQKHYSNNINRMLLSTLNGLKAVKTKFVLKIRTDFYLTGIGFKKFFFQEYPQLDRYKIFKHRIVCYAWKPIRGRFFNIGDFFFFGQICDVLLLFNIPPMSENDMFWFKETHPIIKIASRDDTNRYSSEQYIWITCLRKNGVNIEYRDRFDCSEGFRSLTEDTFVANLVFTTFNEFCIHTKKENLLSFNLENTQREYSFADFVNFCKKVDPNFEPVYKPKCRYLLGDIWRYGGRIIINKKIKRFLRKKIGMFLLSKKI